MATRDPGAGLIGVKPDRPPFTRLVSEYGPIQWGLLDAFGTCSHAGFYKREWALEAGFGDESGGRIWEQKSYEHSTHQSNMFKGPGILRDKAIQMGFATDQQLDDLTGIWDQWSKLSEHEITRECVDMLCFKAGGTSSAVRV